MLVVVISRNRIYEGLRPSGQTAANLWWRTNPGVSAAISIVFIDHIFSADAGGYSETIISIGF